jgi:hypothetical protein
LFVPFFLDFFSFFYFLFLIIHQIWIGLLLLL